MAHTTESLNTHAGNGRLRLARHFRRAVVAGSLLATVGLVGAFPCVSTAYAAGGSLEANDGGEVAPLSGPFESDNKVKVTVRYYNELGNIQELVSDVEVKSGDLTKDSYAHAKSGYRFDNATVDVDGNEFVINGAAVDDTGRVFYSLSGNSSSGVLLGDSDTIYLNYRPVGSTVEVDYTTKGADSVDGNEVISFPKVATKDEAFSFQVSYIRGYKVKVFDEADKPLNHVGDADGILTYSYTPTSSCSLTIEFEKVDEVQFDPGCFNEENYKQLYDEKKDEKGNLIGYESRFTFGDKSGEVQTAKTEGDGADFVFVFTTKTNYNWQCDSLQVNGIYLRVPHTKRKGDYAETTLYSDAAGTCKAKLEVAEVYGYAATYKLTITGAKEDLRIDNANLNGVGWSEVIPVASDGIRFWSASTVEGDFGSEGEGLNKPFATEIQDDNFAPKFKISLMQGYKNLTAKMYSYDVDGNSQLENDGRVIELPDAGQTVYISEGNVPLATVTRDADGAYIIQYSQQTDGSVHNLQFLELTCEKETYGVEYDPGEGEGSVADSNTYSVAGNTSIVVVSGVPRAPAGKFFIGWKLQGDELGTLYSAGDVINLVNALKVAAIQDGDDACDGYIKLVAQYSESPDFDDPVVVSVRYFFEDPNDGGFKEDATLADSTNGVLNATLNWFGAKKELKHDGYTYHLSDTSNLSIEVNGSNAIEIRYELEKAVYVYRVATESKGKGGVSPETETVVAQKKDAAQGSVATPNAGYAFEGWYAEEEDGKSVKITDDNDDKLNVKVVGNKVIPQRHDGQYQGGAFVAKFVEAEDQFGYNMVLPGADWPEGGTPGNLGENGESNTGGQKYVDNTKHGAGEEITVVNTEPVADGQVFIAWFGKAQEDAGHNAGIYKPGSTLVFPCWDTDGKEQTYTLDAIFAGISADDVEVTYDGNFHSITVQTGFSDVYQQLECKDELERLGVSVDKVEYSMDEGKSWIESNPSFKDVGTHEVLVKAEVTIGEVKKFVQTKAAVVIKPKPLVITIEDGSKIFGENDPDFGTASVYEKNPDGTLKLVSFDDLDNYIVSDLEGINLAVIRSDSADNSVGTHYGALNISTPMLELQKYANYSFTVNLGDFTVLKDEGLSVYAADVDKVYDGNSYSINVEVLVDGEDANGADIDIFYLNEETDQFDLTTCPTYRNWTNGPVTVRFKACLEGYEDAYGSAEITIEKRNIKAVGSTSKVWDGNTSLLNDVKLQLTSVDDNPENGVVNGDEISAMLSKEDAHYARAEVHETEPLVASEGGSSLAEAVRVSGKDAANYHVVEASVFGTISSGDGGEVNPDPDPGTDPSDPDPDQPENPDPEDPDPDQPENPDPEEPEDPDPDTPEQPDNPDQPDQPDNPDIPDNPDTPDQPDNPDTPDQPNQPDTPSTPDTPVTPSNPTPTPTPATPTPTTPGRGYTPADNGTPTDTIVPVGDGTPTDDGVTPDEDIATPDETIADDDTPLAGGETIEDEDTPLTSGEQHRTCWTHWLMLVGLVASAAYFVVALVHRKKFTTDLKSFEDSVLDSNNRKNA